MKTKGFLASEIFTYIMLLVVAALILMFGYKAIHYFQDRSAEIARLELKSNLERNMKDTMSYGSVKKFSYLVPNDVREVCFIDWKKAPNIDKDKYPLIYETWELSWTSQTLKENVFLYSSTLDTEEFALSVNDRSLFSIGEESYRCIPILNGELTLRFEGRGDSVEIVTSS